MHDSLTTTIANQFDITHNYTCMEAARIQRSDVDAAYLLRG